MNEDPAVPAESRPEPGTLPCPEAGADDPNPAPGMPGSESSLVEANRVLLDRLRAFMLASDPDVAPGLVVGDTLEELETSFDAARELVARIRDAVRAQAPASVPAGSPGRALPQARNAFEKIRSGLEQR